MDVKGVSGYHLFGRTSQKRRTREALKRAAADLLRSGVTPTVADVADVALVSKSTAYRYFASQEALVAEVVLDEVVAAGIRELDHLAAASGTPAARVDAVVHADHQLVLKHESAFRTALRAMVTPRDDEGDETPRRPGNRLRYLGEAVAPLRGEVGAEPFERLVAALALCVGIESVVVTKDVCGLRAEAADSVKRWAAAALLQTALREAAAGVSAEGSPRRAGRPAGDGGRNPSRRRRRDGS